MSETEKRAKEKQQPETAASEDDETNHPTEEEMAKQKELEKKEQAEFNLRYPARGGTSELLQKRLSRGNKYFDSGDYNMAKAKVGLGAKLLPGQKPPLLLGQTGEAIPTPETVPHKKVGPQQSKLINSS